MKKGVKVIPHRKLSASNAKKYTANVKPEEEFVTSSGRKIKNMYELYNVLSEMDDEHFSHHVNEQKNDFQSWIYHVIKDKHLAKLLSKLKLKDEILEILDKRIGNYRRTLEKWADRGAGITRGSKQAKHDASAKTSSRIDRKIDELKVIIDKKEFDSYPEAAVKNPRTENNNLILDSTYMHEMTPGEINRALRKEFVLGFVLGILVGFLLYIVLIY